MDMNDRGGSALIGESVRFKLVVMVGVETGDEPVCRILLQRYAAKEVELTKILI